MEFRTIDATRNAIEKLNSTPIHGNSISAQYTAVTHAANPFTNNERASRMNSIGSNESIGGGSGIKPPHHPGVHRMGMPPSIPHHMGYGPPPFAWPGQYGYPGMCTMKFQR